jgi:hypothetical protein
LQLFIMRELFFLYLRNHLNEPGIYFPEIFSAFFQ